MLIYPPLTKRMFNINVSVFLSLLCNSSGSGLSFLCVHTFDGALLKEPNYDLKHAD